MKEISLPAGFANWSEYRQAIEVAASMLYDRSPTEAKKLYAQVVDELPTLVKTCGGNATLMEILHRKEEEEDDDDGWEDEEE